MTKFAIPLVLVTLIAAAYGQPQPFSSGSTGADGALTYAANLGEVHFPPNGLAPRANNIYHFTTITIGAGTTVRLSGWVFSGPVYWLAQGDVTINGTVDLSGRAGHAANNPSYRAPSEPGPGGYSGGVARLSTGQPATAGNGPGGGLAPGWNSSNTQFGGPASYTGSSYLQPLIGGSGGGGGCSTGIGCGGGGAGGGAILIASSTKIANNGLINAIGGAVGNLGGGGSGGAVRLVANSIVSGFVYVCGGPDPTGGARGGGGVVRYEAYALSGTTGARDCAINTSAGIALTSLPYNVAPPVAGPSTISVTSVNGITINANPFVFPDATINTSAPVPVVITGANVPPGTAGTLVIYSESAPDQTLPFTLTGTLASTTATVNVTWPTGGSRGFARAIWNQ